MIKYVALYRKPDNPNSFDEQYFATHLPLVEKTPGLLRTEVARIRRTFLPGFLGDTSPYLIAEMYFESRQALDEALASQEWKDAGANLKEIGGLELVAMFSAELVEDASS